MRNVKRTTAKTLWRPRFAASYVLAGLLLLCLVGCSEEQKSTELLFVQTAHRVTYNDGTITLHDVAPTTLFFSDRPERVTGHQGTQVFIDNWDKGHNSFAEDPPNAALVMLGDHDTEVAEVIVELKDPKYAGNDLSYKVIVLEGEMPSSGEVSALFIDAIIITDPDYIYGGPVVMGPAYGPLSYRGQSRRVARRTARRVSRRR